MSVFLRLPNLTGLTERLRKAALPTVEDVRYLANEAVAVIQKRTAVDGKDRFGNDFQPYSRTPTYIGGKYADYARTAGGRSTYLNGRKRLTGKKTAGGKDARTGNMKSVYFQGGYEQFKQGLAPSGFASSGRVNLTVSGEMLGTMIAGVDLESDGAFGVGTVTDKSFSLTFTRAEYGPIADGLIERGRDFWGIGDTESEKKYLEGILADRIRMRIKEVAEKYNAGN